MSDASGSGPKEEGSAGSSVGSGADISVVATDPA
jgi:hypothetical protein